MLFLILTWSVFLLQDNYNWKLSHFGVLPRDIRGLCGILTSVLVHSNLEHIASNSIPLLVLGMLLFFFYEKIAKQVFLWIWIVSGIWLWIGGRNSENHPVYHLGASTLIYGLATFLFFSGVFRRHLRLMVVSALVVFLYGSIMWGIFPLKEEISWEGHLFGAISGVLVAYNYRKEGPQKKVYEWENEPEEDEREEEQNEFWKETPNDQLTIRYMYKEKAKQENSGNEQ